MYIINSQIKDIDTGEQLPGATVQLTDSTGKPILVNGHAIGRIADANGRIIIPVIPIGAYIKVSYMGYITLIHPAEDYKNDDIYLKKTSKNLNEVVVTAKKNTPPTTIIPKKTPWLFIAGASLVLLAIIIYFIPKK